MKKPGSATIKDVAEATGVHASTVSRALSPATRHMVRAEIVQRVEEAARHLGYYRNALASSLRTKRSFTVGVVIPDITNPVFPPILRGIEDVLGAANFTAIIANTDNSADRQETVVNRMKGRHIDGLILATVARNDPIIPQCVQDGLPVVVVNRGLDNDDVSSVVTDDARGVRLAVDHLASLGHRRIAHVAGPQELSTGYIRYRAFLDAMRAKDLDLDEGLIAFCKSFSEAEGRRVCKGLLNKRVLNKRSGFSAIVAANDLLALGCYDALAEHGLRCPQDVSVTGFNDMPYVDKLTPPLTTVRIQHYEIGVQAAQLLLKQIENPASPRMSIKLAPEIKVRGSTTLVQKSAGGLEFVA